MTDYINLTINSNQRKQKKKYPDYWVHKFDGMAIWDNIQT